MKDGLPLQPWAAELQRRRDAENSKDNPDALCLPMGLMQFHNHGMPRKMVQTRDVLVITYEANYGLRTIFTDGRPLPGAEAQPWWYGYSTGAGTATRSSSRRPGFATTAGSTSSATR